MKTRGRRIAAQLQFLISLTKAKRGSHGSSFFVPNFCLKLLLIWNKEHVLIILSFCVGYKPNEQTDFLFGGGRFVAADEYIRAKRG